MFSSRHRVIVSRNSRYRSTDFSGRSHEIFLTHLGGSSYPPALRSYGVARHTEVPRGAQNACDARHVAAVLRSTRAIQAADKLLLGEEYEPSGFVVVNEWGAALSPHALTSRWARIIKAGGVRHIRYHDALHTCGTPMHLQDVPIAVISARLGHASKAFTIQTYVHSQPEALAMAAQIFARVVTNGDNSRRRLECSIRSRNSL